MKKPTNYEVSLIRLEDKSPAFENLKTIFSLNDDDIENIKCALHAQIPYVLKTAPADICATCTSYFIHLCQLSEIDAELKVDPVTK